MKDLITVACLVLAVSFAPTYSVAGERDANDNSPSTYGAAGNDEDSNAMASGTMDSNSTNSSAMNEDSRVAVDADSRTAVDEDSDMDRSSPSAFVKDSAITAKVKAKLASDHIGSLASIQVDTDANGIVWLSGTVSTQMEADEAVATAKATEGVVNVKNRLKVRPS